MEWRRDVYFTKEPLMNILLGTVLRSYGKVVKIKLFEKTKQTSHDYYLWASLVHPSPQNLHMPHSARP